MRLKPVYLIVLFLLSLGGALYSFKEYKRPVDPEKLAAEVSPRIQLLLDDADAEAQKILSDFHSNPILPASKFIFLLLKEGEIVSWNDHHVIPPEGAFNSDFVVTFLKTGAGDFLARKWVVNANYSLIALIPLHIGYKINNEYLIPYWNPAVFNSPAISIHEPDATQGYAVTLDKQIVFKILPAPGMNGVWGYLAAFFFFIAMAVVVVWSGKAIRRIALNYPGIGFLLTVSLVLIVRGAMIYLEFPSRFIDSVLFDPTVFASSELNPSLGDLALNAVALCILCFYLFRTYYRYDFFKRAVSTSVLTKWVLSAFCIVAILFATLFGFVVIQTIYNNSSITLAVSASLDVNVLRLVAFFSLGLCWVSCFLFMHVFVRLLMSDNNWTRIAVAILIGTIVFTAINEFTGQYFISSLLTGLFYLGCVVLMKLYRGLQALRYLTFLYFFIAVLALSLNGVIAVHNHEQKRIIESQLRFASNFLVERDYFAEYLLHESSGRIASDAFIQTRMATPILGKDIIRQKITQVFLSGYFSRYNQVVYLYNSSGEPLDEGNTSTFSDLLSLYDKEAYKTEYSNIYFLANEDGDFAKKYVALIPLVKSNFNVGYIVIELSLKRIIPENVYPELLVDSRFQVDDQAVKFSYAITQKDSIQYSAGDFNYGSFVKRNLGKTQLYSKGIIDEGHLHVAIEDANESIAIVSSPVRPIIARVSDFSLLVLMGMTMVLVFLIIRGFIDYSRSQNLYLAARIQLILNLAIFLPLVAVSIVTLTITTRSSLQQLQDEYLAKAKKFGLTIAGTLEGNNSESEFQVDLTRMASLANLDANLFSLEGRLLSTSQPLIFENHLLSPFIDHRVLERIRQGDKSFIATEQVGELQFYVAYSALLSPASGVPVGILGIPFFQTAASLEQLQIKVFTNILSVFTLIFILLLFISFIVAKWLTEPLNLITKTLSRLSLTHENAPLEWKSDDEIGLMIKEYNQMLGKLRESKLQLEQKQRELAWREIAQQVAHEIKNPLTPMKLTLQQLERGLASTSPDKLGKAVQSLLAQVNSLNDIASSFSSFAKMPEPVLAELELNALIMKVVDLHQHEGEIHVESAVSVAKIVGDEKLLLRIFSNIVLNGLQAVASGTRPQINIQLIMKEDTYQISFSDNGKGIDAAWIDKIFIPHFTTKKSGSGLGLAIAKQGIEQLEGKIWFESSSSGTTFFIALKALK